MPGSLVPKHPAARRPSTVKRLQAEKQAVNSLETPVNTGNEAVPKQAEGFFEC
jgi:hypothetical protein